MKNPDPSMQEHTVNLLDNFIGGWIPEDTSICDKLVEFHSVSKQIDGEVKSIGGGYVDVSVKESKDVTLLGELRRKYVQEYLHPVMLEYMKKYPRANDVDLFNIVEPVMIQRYNPPTGGFHKWHCERAGVGIPQNMRHLVFMTYLNDVDDGGETEFLHQNLKIKPQKGLTLIWPVIWTHTHRGLPSATQEKYVVTGWYSHY